MYCDCPKHVTLKTRLWSTDIWTPEDQETQLEVFELDLNGEQKIPTGFVIAAIYLFNENFIQLDEYIKKSIWIQYACPP